MIHQYKMFETPNKVCRPPRPPVRRDLPLGPVRRDLPLGPAAFTGRVQRIPTQLILGTERGSE